MKIYIAFALTLLLFSGCDIFDTRQAERPVNSRSSFEFPASPEIVVQNLTNSLLEKNSQDYIACLVDSNYCAKTYSFVPSSGTGSIYPALAGDWSVKSEEQYFKNIVVKLTTDQGITLTLSNEKYYQGVDSTVYTADYKIQLPQSAVFTNSFFQGSLSFTMIMDSRSEWVITRWIDVKSPTDLCWSDMKGLYY
jgi:hypothetical protein